MVFPRGVGASQPGRQAHDKDRRSRPRSGAVRRPCRGPDGLAPLRARREERPPARRSSPAFRSGVGGSGAEPLRSAEPNRRCVRSSGTAGRHADLADHRHRRVEQKDSVTTKAPPVLAKARAGPHVKRTHSANLLGCPGGSTEERHALSVRGPSTQGYTQGSVSFRTERHDTTRHGYQDVAVG